MESLPEALGAKEVSEHEAAEEFLDGFHQLRVGSGEEKEVALLREDAPGREGMEVRVRMCEGPVRLDRGHESRHDAPALEDRGEGAPERLVGRAREDPEEVPLPLEEGPDRAGDREDPVVMGDGGEDLLAELLREEGGALGLA